MFPTPGNNAVTGYINGQNIVGCPDQCHLYQGAPIYNTNDAGTHGNVYNMSDIGGYYCAINSGPPIPHTQRPEGYTTKYYHVWSNDWDNSYSVEESTEDEIYQNPQTNYLYNTFNSTPTCVDEHLSTPAPPPDPSGSCYENPQQSLSWFRLNTSLFK